MKTTIIGLILSVMLAAPALGAEVEVQSAMAPVATTNVAFLPLMTTPSSQSSVKEVADSRWAFVGCVVSHHQCHDIAAHHGYHHAVVRHNHHQCHHSPHFACYGRN